MPSESHLKLPVVVIGVDGLNSDNTSQQRGKVAVDKRVLLREMERGYINVRCAFADGRV